MLIVGHVLALVYTGTNNVAQVLVGSAIGIGMGVPVGLFITKMAAPLFDNVLRNVPILVWFGFHNTLMKEASVKEIKKEKKEESMRV